MYTVNVSIYVYLSISFLISLSKHMAYYICHVIVIGHVSQYIKLTEIHFFPKTCMYNQISECKHVFLFYKQLNVEWNARVWFDVFSGRWLWMSMIVFVRMFAAMLLLTLIGSRLSTLIGLEIWSWRLANWFEREVLIESQIALWWSFTLVGGKTDLFVLVKQLKRMAEWSMERMIYREILNAAINGRWGNYIIIHIAWINSAILMCLWIVSNYK